MLISMVFRGPTIYSTVVEENIVAWFKDVISFPQEDYFFDFKSLWLIEDT